MKIEFEASLPPIMSAINFDGTGDGSRIKIDVSRQYNSEVLKLQELAGKSMDDMMKVRNLGKKSLEEVERKLKELGLSLKLSDE